MIVCKKPWMVYDVDLAGLGALAALAALGYFLVVVPLQSHFEQYYSLSGQYRAAEADLRQTSQRLRKTERDITRLAAGIATLAGQAPHPGSLPQFLSRVTALAEAARVQVVQVLPTAPRAVDGYLVADVEMSGRGRSLDFVRFLDALARASPYQSLRQFSITRAADSPDGVCTLSWTIRVYMLPPEPAAADGGTS